MPANKKHILMILQADYPPDIRLTKEIAALTEQGYKVFLLCNNNPPAAAGGVDGATVCVLPIGVRAGLRSSHPPLFFNPLCCGHPAGDPRA